ncbi:hypothetical protein FKP32DRAFT_42452 [Trametes sanguinea]|nr:hypothetical protein FKP32DRAFT_42452 [Trametes sanguinea]
MGTSLSAIGISRRCASSVRSYLHIHWSLFLPLSCLALPHAKLFEHQRTPLDPALEVPRPPSSTPSHDHRGQSAPRPHHHSHPTLLRHLRPSSKVNLASLCSSPHLD